MAKYQTYINKEEAIELGLPDLRGTVNKKGYKFLHYAMSRLSVKMRFGCRECGYKKHPAALHFNHLNQETKSTNVSRISTWMKLKNEIRKCEILCANCHAIHSVENKHHLKFNHTIHEET